MSSIRSSQKADLFDAEMQQSAHLFQPERSDHDEGADGTQPEALSDASFTSFQMPLAEDLSHEELLYLRSYHSVLSDAGFVEEKPGICKRVMIFLRSLLSSSRANAASLKIRRLKCLYLLLALFSGLSITGYLLTVSVQGHLELVLQSRQVSAPDGLRPPLFGVCHTFFNIDQYNIVDEKSSLPLDYELENFVEPVPFDPIFFTNKSTRALAYQYSPSNSIGPSCFYHNMLPQLLGTNFDRLKTFVATVVLSQSVATFDQYIEKGSWRNCAVCHSPSGIKQSLNMRFDFSLPEEKPASLKDLPDNVFKYFRLKKQVFKRGSSIPVLQTAVWMQLNCSNPVKCGEGEGYPYNCCMQNLYDAVNPSKLNFITADLVDIPSTIVGRFINDVYIFNQADAFRLRPPAAVPIGLFPSLTGSPQEQPGAINKQFWRTLLEWDVANDIPNATSPGPNSVLDFYNQRVSQSNGLLIPSLKPTLVAKMSPASLLVTEKSLVPGNTPIIGQLGIIASLISLIANVFFWLTGQEASYNQRLFRFFPDGKASLQKSVASLLPPNLLRKLQRRKLVEVGDGEEQLVGRMYKML